MIKKLLFLGIIIFLFSHIATAQKIYRPPLDPAQELPAWVSLLYAEDPNVAEVDRAYLAYYQAHPFKKTTYTQFYKKWRRAVNDYINEDGFVRHPSLAEKKRLEEEYAAKIALGREQRSGLSTEWECLGPYEMINDAVDGTQVPVSWQVNIYSIDQSVSNPDILFAGTEGGEVYKTTDKGLHWSPVSRSLDLGAVLAIAIDPSDPETVFAGDGSRVYKTSDGGNTWTMVFEFSGFEVNDIAVAPNNSNIVLLAGFKGLRRSVDGGNTWTSLYAQACYDLEYKPGDANTVYLLKNNPVAKICEFLKSTDGGTTFTVQGDGWYNSSDPAREDGGARLAVTPADPNRIYAILIGQSKPGDQGYIGLFASEDAGESWTLPNGPVGGPYSNSHPNMAVIDPFTNDESYHQGFYNLSIMASHVDADQVIAGFLSTWKSVNGGVNFTRIGGYGGSLPWMHPDVQEVRTLGNDTWVCTDGGINYSTNFFINHESRKYGITGSDYWGFGQGWNEDVIVGGRYHNGNSAWYQTYESGVHLRLGGAEAPTGYVNPSNGRKTFYSDISGKLLSPLQNTPTTNFFVGKFPNEAYYPVESSEVVYDPRCYNHFYLGNENKFWKTEDNGTSFTLIKAFGTNIEARVTHIEIARSNPAVMYVFQRNASTWNDGFLWKTTDGGLTWSPVSMPAGSKRRIALAVSPEDENMLVLGYADGANGQKVYRTTDGGLTWENWTSSLLDNEAVHTLLFTGGANGAVYLGTSRTVYYRNNDSEDWELYNEGLPYSIYCNILNPFYRDGKLRLGAYSKAFWQVDLKDEFTPVCQPMADKLTSYCPRDSFYFDDYSILKHAGASWLWNFPTGSPATANIRNPVVQFSGTGEHTATLTVTDINGNSHSKSIVLTVLNECTADTIPGFAISLENDGDAAVATDVNGPVLLPATFSAWVRPTGIQVDNAGIVMGKSIAGANYGISVGQNNELTYYWPGGTSGFLSDMYLPVNEWSHVALVVETDTITIYLNGTGVKQVSFPLGIQLNNLHIGRFVDNNERNWKGKIDEVAIWKRALSREEIRDLLHLAKNPEADPDLVAYWQFNRPTGIETDRAGIRHLSLQGGAVRVNSGVPIGGGISHRMTINNGGEKIFGPTGLTMYFSNTGNFPNGEVVVTRINLQPDVAPEPEHPNSRSYWAVNNYGQNSLGAVTDIRLEGLGDIPAGTDQNDISLYLRGWNEDGPLWGEWTSAEELTTGADGSASFGDIEFLGQLIVVNKGLGVAAQQPGQTEYLPQPVLLYPNPVPANGNIFIKTNLAEPVQLKIWNAQGSSVYSGLVQDGDKVNTKGWVAGAYFYEVVTANKRWTGVMSCE